MDPSQEEIVRYMEFTIDNYVDYVLWLIRMDFEGSGNKNYYADYLKGDKNAPVDIYPAMEEIAPWLREPTKETTITKEKKPSAIVELWDTARAGDWRKFGQWPQAKAAGILWLGSLLAFGILFSTYSLIGNIYEIESCVGKLFETFIGLAMLCVFVATYLLLQAIF